MKTLFPLLLLSPLLPLALAQASSETITLETASGSLHGTLELPAGSGPFPVALIHPGSGDPPTATATAPAWRAATTVSNASPKASASSVWPRCGSTNAA